MGFFGTFTGHLVHLLVESSLAMGFSFLLTYFITSLVNLFPAIPFQAALLKQPVDGGETAEDLGLVHDGAFRYIRREMGRVSS